MINEINIEILMRTLSTFERGGGELSEAERRESVVYSEERVRALCSSPSCEGAINIGGRTSISVVNQDSFAAAMDLNNDYLYKMDKRKKEILVLNFANPVHPGGGVRRGANAQEEDLCRKSSLLLSLESENARSFYSKHEKLGHWLASDAMILSPKVEIIRDENNKFLEESIVVAVLTCAAPAIKYEPTPISKEALEQLLYNRIMGMLHVAAANGYEYLVLGAWGCGAFGNDPDMVSDMFYKAMKDFQCGRLRLKDKFSRIVFAVLDRSDAKRNLNAFKRNFDYFYRDADEEETRQALERIKATEVNLDAIRGSMLGGAIGDALGYPVEFLDYNAIVSLYGENGITSYELDRNTGKALISDDTQMTMFTACGILYGETRLAMRGIGADPHVYVHRAYLDWLYTQGGEKSDSPISWILSEKGLFSLRAPGNTCLSALRSGICGSVNNHINNSKGCGGVMRIAPLPLAYADWHREEQLELLDKEGAEIAAITHGHPLGYIPAAFLTHVIHEAAFNKDSERTLKTIVSEALTTTEKLFGTDEHWSYFAALIQKAVEYAGNSRFDVDNIHALGGGWVAEEAVAIAVYCSLRYSDDFSGGVIAAVNHSGDSDSTGAITGNILGAWLGYDAIEEKWKEKLELHDTILELADDLCHGCQMSEYSRYTDEAWVKKYIRGSYFAINRMLRGM